MNHLGENLHLLDDGLYETLTPFTIGYKSWLITVPAGFKTDIASVPQIFWSLGIVPDGRHRNAAIVHDYICRYRGQVNGYSLHRKDADDIFYDLMSKANVPWWRRKLMYLAVRAFGWTTKSGNF